MGNPFAFYENDLPVSTAISGGMVWVTLADGRVIGNPLAWHPWLEQATPEQQANVEYHAHSVDWPDLYEGLDIQGMLQGLRPMTPELISS